MKWAKLLVFLLFLGIVSTSFVFYRFANEAKDAAATSKKVEIDVLKGMRPHEISFALEKEGVIKNSALFYWLGRITGGWSGIRAADYELSPSLTPLQIFKILKSGIGIQRSILIREGNNIFQVAEIFEKEGLGTRNSTQSDQADGGCLFAHLDARIRGPCQGDRSFAERSGDSCLDG